MNCRILTIAALLSSLISISCSQDLDAPERIESAKSEAQKPMPWTWNDDPSLFSNDLIYTLGELPENGAAELAPWTASYWPNYKDSINYKWEGGDSLSPAAKYGEAYNISGVEDAVSSMRGVDSQSHRTACTTNDDCDEELVEECAKRDGEEQGYCIPTWFGICHAWAPASIMVPEPKYPVIDNGVEFKVNDIKALVTILHDNVENKFASGRCNHNDAQDDIEYDENGRPLAGECIDTNPATFHILLGNYLGLQKQSFVYDRTYDSQVWNQPIRAYRVTQVSEVTATEANDAIGVSRIGARTHDFAAEVAQGEWHHFESLSVEPGETVTLQMSGDGDGDLFARFGAQPNAGEFVCRPYDSGSAESCELVVPEGESALFVSVNGYSDAEVELSVQIGGDAPVGYAYNTNATKFYNVFLEVDYIAESDAEIDGHLEHDLDRYTHTDRYNYILEEDASGRLVGGEWLGQSKRNHPDFLWLPIRLTARSVAGGKLNAQRIMSLLERSVVEPDVGGIDTRDVVVESGALIARGDMHQFGPYVVAEDSEIRVNLSGSGDADLYVRKGAAPSTAAWDCRPYVDGSNEDCVLAGPGRFFIGVMGYANSSDYDIRIEYTEGESADEGVEDEGGEDEGGEDEGGEDEGGENEGGEDEGGEDEGGEGDTHLNVSGTLTLNAFDHYSINVSAGTPVYVRTTGATDIDVYLRMEQAPTTSDYVAKGYTASGDETVHFVPTADGVLHIGVHGYEAGDYTLTTAND